MHEDHATATQDLCSTLRALRARAQVILDANSEALYVAESRRPMATRTIRLSASVDALAYALDAIDEAATQFEVAASA